MPESPLGTPGRPRDAGAQTPAVSVPSTSGYPSEAPEERDLDWEDYNYERKPAAGGGRQAENPLAALLAGIPDFNTKELEALLNDLPTPDNANQAAVMTMAEAVEVSDIFRLARGKHLLITCYLTSIHSV